MAVNKKIMKFLKYLGGIILYGLEYLVRYEVVFFYILAQLTDLFTTCVIHIVFKMKVKVLGSFSQQFISILNQIKFHGFRVIL